MQHEERKKQYLLCFSEAFSQGGVDNTSVKKLARAAEINEASIYQYFRSKDEIIVECVKMFFTDLRAKIIPILTATKKTPQQMVERLLRVRSKSSKYEKFVIQVLTSPTYSEKCRPILEDFIHGMEDICGRIADEHGFSREAAQAAMRCLAGSLLCDRIYPDKDSLENQAASILKFLEASRMTGKTAIAG